MVQVIVNNSQGWGFKSLCFCFFFFS
jgi:hypothetical protein